MSANPILVERTRGSLVESWHRGAVAVADSGGRTILVVGDIDRPTFPRSAVKSLQALAIYSSGAAERYALRPQDLALACASHRGEDIHVQGVAAFLERLGLGEGDLECGAQPPASPAAREALRRAGADPSPLHHNCSGKHAGMLAVARALGVATAGYVRPEHPVQQEVRRAMEAALGLTLDASRFGTDGCSVPTWATPTKALARGFARMTGGALPGGLAEAAHALFEAATAHPLLVAGADHFDTVVMQAFGGRVMQKGGAEGVQCGAIRDRGLGYAIKVDDGDMAASLAIAASLLLALAQPDADQRAVLERFARAPLRNARGIVVGELRGTAELAGAISAAKLPR